RQLHWAQAKVYGALMCRKLGADKLPKIRIALVYFDVQDRQETAFVEEHSAETLEAFFQKQCRRFLAWGRQEAAHREARDEALRGLRFPHADFRVGQRQLSESVYKAASSGRCLMAQAPTGIGKTVGTLFPLLKAAPLQKLDKVFFLAAKTPGRALALEAVDVIRRGAPGLPLRVVELVARDKACEHPDKACHGDSCPLARGFYDRLPAARLAAVGASSPLVPRSASQDFVVSSQGDELKSEVSVGPTQRPHGATQVDPCQVDHPQVDPSRVDPSQVKHSQAAVDLPAAINPHPTPSRTLDRATLRSIALAHDVCPYYLAQELVRWSDVVVGDYNYWFDLTAMLHGMTQTLQWKVGVLVDEAHNLVDRARKMFSAELVESQLAAVRRTAPKALGGVLARLAREWKDLRSGSSADYEVVDQVPASFTAAVQQVVSSFTDHLAEQPAGGDSELLRFYFDVLHFMRLLELFGKHTLFDVTSTPGGDSTLCLRNIVPAPFLKSRFAAAHSTVLFSATLSPRHYHADLLGLPEDTGWVDVESPFRPEQLDVQVATHISTRYQRRGASVLPIADLIAAQYARRAGNYLAFFSSFDYLQQVAAELASRHPQVPVWAQSRRMSEFDRRGFLDRFTQHSEGVGFAVLGGSFAEGIDLPGKRLIGAFIVTLGLPQINPVNEQIRLRMEATFGEKARAGVADGDTDSDTDSDADGDVDDWRRDPEGGNRDAGRPGDTPARLASGRASSRAGTALVGSAFDGPGYDYTYLYPGLQKVVQAAGRVIRTVTDEGVIHLIDDRFRRPEVLELLPSWWAVDAGRKAAPRPGADRPASGGRWRAP
ncbi:MAG: box helicase family protein, partial [Rhizobacter sp.]|nr:box helicase family protein [Rhizobacter sp.]